MLKFAVSRDVIGIRINRAVTTDSYHNRRDAVAAHDQP